MTLESQCQTLDPSKDFVKPRSMTLTPEELRKIPPPKKHESQRLAKLIKNNFNHTGIARGWTRIRKAFGKEEFSENGKEPECHKQRSLEPPLNVSQPQTPVRKNFMFNEPDLSENEKEPECQKPRSLESPLIVSQTQTPVRKDYMFDEPGFSPQISMNTVPSPSMHVGLSTPESARSETENSDCSSLTEGLRILPRCDSLIVPCKLKLTSIQPHIFEFSDDYDDYDDDYGDYDDYEKICKELQEQINTMTLPPIGK